MPSQNYTGPAAAAGCLAEGLEKLSASAVVPELVVPYYADLLREAAPEELQDGGDVASTLQSAEHKFHEIAMERGLEDSALQ